jgi:hypothetical protein
MIITQMKHKNIFIFSSIVCSNFVFILNRGNTKHLIFDQKIYLFETFLQSLLNALFNISYFTLKTYFTLH